MAIQTGATLDCFAPLAMTEPRPDSGHNQPLPRPDPRADRWLDPDRQREFIEALADLMEQRVHALSIKAMAPGEQPIPGRNIPKRWRETDVPPRT